MEHYCAEGSVQTGDLRGNNKWNLNSLFSIRFKCTPAHSAVEWKSPFVRLNKQQIDISVLPYGIFIIFSLICNQSTFCKHTYIAYIDINLLFLEYFWGSDPFHAWRLFEGRISCTMTRRGLGTLLLSSGQKETSYTWSSHMCTCQCHDPSQGCDQAHEQSCQSVCL